jgi:hypothetical protein
MGLFCPFGDLFGRVLEAFWGVLAASEAVWGDVGRLGATIGRLGSRLERPESFLVAFCGPQGRTWAVLGASWAVLRLSWAVLGPSGAPLGLAWGCLGGLRRRHELYGSENN